jgi:hypothetical protein
MGYVLKMTDGAQFLRKFDNAELKNIGLFCKRLVILVQAAFMG